MLQRQMCIRDRGYMVKNMSEGVKNAGSNSGGAMQGFMGVGMGMSTMGNMMNRCV